MRIRYWAWPMIFLLWAHAGCGATGASRYQGGAGPGTVVERLEEHEGAKGPYPIVLVHGFSGFNSLGPLHYFYRVREVLAEEGETWIFAPPLPPYHGIEERAPYLARAIDGILERTGAGKVHLIAHSQGGLDARYVLSALGYRQRVASLITVATPHQGTPLADFVLRLPEVLLDPVARTWAWIIGALEDRERTWRTDLTASMASLSTKSMSSFNERFPDPPEVPLYSVAGVSNLSRAHEICRDGRWGALEGVDVIDPLLLGTAIVLAGANVLDPVPNDGIVPTASMKRGVFLGCIPADHFDQVGHLLDSGPQLVSGFDHLAFYRGLVSMIRRFEKTGFPVE